MTRAISNGNLPASPSSVSNSEGVFEDSDSTGLGYGLTKREHFAAMAMQNILTSFNPYEQGDFDSSDFELTAKLSVGMADALLKELSK